MSKLPATITILDGKVRKRSQSASAKHRAEDPLFREAAEKAPNPPLFAQPTVEDCDPSLWGKLGGGGLEDACTYARDDLSELMSTITQSSRKAQLMELSRIYDLETVMLAMNEARRGAIMQVLGCRGSSAKIGLSLLRGLCYGEERLEALDEDARKAVLTDLSRLSRALTGARIMGVGPKGFRTFAAKEGGIQGCVKIAQSAMRDRRKVAEVLKELDDRIQASDHQSEAAVVKIENLTADSPPTERAVQPVRARSPSAPPVELTLEASQALRHGQSALAALRWVDGVLHITAVDRRPKGFRDNDKRLLRACAQAFAHSGRTAKVMALIEREMASAVADDDR